MASPLQLAPTSWQYRLKAANQQTQPNREQPVEAPQLERKGANTPLLETGSIRDSISHKAELSAVGAEGLVYSDDIKALWQELGTSRGIPPRSFLYQSLLRCDPEIESAFRAFMESLFT
jgi:hypothetical protein